METARKKSLKSKEIRELTLKCKKCEKEFKLTLTNSQINRGEYKKYCSTNCSKSRIRDEKVKANISKGVLDYISKGGIVNNKKGLEIVAREARICANLICGNEFRVISSKKKQYCSKECLNLSSGGYREGSGRSKHGYYKGIYCGSTYELVWVIYNLDHNISFVRFPSMLECNGIKYIPDFLIGNKIHEIKGFGDPVKISQKCEVAIANGYEIEVFYKNDIKHMFQYVEKTYKTKKFHELYDTYTPKYKYICSGCSEEYESDVVKKSKLQYCSRTCSRTNINRHVSISRESILELHSRKYTIKEIASELKCNMSHLTKVMNGMKLKPNRTSFEKTRKIKISDVDFLELLKNSNYSKIAKMFNVCRSTVRALHLRIIKRSTIVLKPI